MTLEHPTTIRRSLSDDHHRPHYHYLPPSNWMNDPNGLIQWHGTYHLFYQHNPFGPLWGNMSWGHASSQDLIHWEDLPLALEPIPGTYDEAGCFSGCAVNNDGTPTIIYTSTSNERHHNQTQSIATSNDDLIIWHKHSQNPVLAGVPPEMGQTNDSRDPYVWREDGTWYMVLGSGIKGKAGTILLYRSENLVDWEYLNPIIEGEKGKHGAIWECPNFFKLDDKWVLIISAHTGSITDTVFYFVGTYENYRFTPEYSDVLDYGNLYAPLTFRDEQGRMILFGWLREARSEVDQRLAGWSGVQSIPRILSVDENNRLLMKPVPELGSIRGKHHTVESMPISQETPLDVHGLQLDIEAEFKVEANGTCGFTLASSDTNREQIDIVYDNRKHVLSVRKVYPETNGALTTHIREVPHLLASDENLQLRILLDASVVEIIANDRTSLTSRNYPSDKASTGVKLIGENATLAQLDIWEMSSIW